MFGLNWGQVFAVSGWPTSHGWEAEKPKDEDTTDASMLKIGNSIPLRVGGMAFGNGVLMRGPHHWAWARTDGSVIEGSLRARPSRRWLRLPVLRSAIALFQTIGLMILLHRRNGVRRSARLLGWLGVCLAFDFYLSFVVPEWIRSPLLSVIILQGLGFALALLTLRLGLGTAVWRFHGAEHKAVNAYEAGADLDDTEAVMTYSRIHDRCGTNLIAIMVVLLLLGYLPLGSSVLGGVLGIIYSLIVVAVSFELFRLIARRPTSWVSRAVLAPGKALQRGLTTREPEGEQLRLACIALRRVVDREAGT